jgi:hypothetical protein
MRTYNEIKEGVVKKGYAWFAGNIDLNCIWERTSDTYTNKFTDWLHIAYIDNGIEKVLSLPATTKPGLHGSILNPTTVFGVTGTAVIVPGQYRSAWSFVDSYEGWTHYPYFQQVGKVDYWRDFNKDTIVDHVQLQNDKIFGTNWHRMSNVGHSGGNVDNWSLGCMGCEEPEWKKALPIFRQSVKLYGNLITGTLLETKDFNL